MSVSHQYQQEQREPHAPEPWQFDSDHAPIYIQDSQAFSVASIVANYSDEEARAVANAHRIIACVNACAGIPNEALASLDWQLMPKGGAKPELVAGLLLKLRKYEAALAKIAQVSTEDFAYVGDLKDIANDALKP